MIAAASLLRKLCYHNKDELQAGFITAGWDPHKGPQVGTPFNPRPRLPPGLQPDPRPGTGDPPGPQGHLVTDSEACIAIRCESRWGQVCLGVSR